MRNITATEVARGLSDVLDEVEYRGETFVISRNGRPIARLEPAVGASGRALKDLLAAAPRDPAWASDLEALRARFPAEVPTWDE